MCISTPRVNTVSPAVEAPIETESMDAADSTVAMRDSDLRRRQRALSRLSTMRGGAMQGVDAVTGKVKLGV